jgi:hypothetical protein
MMKMSRFPEPETSAGRGEVRTAVILVAGSRARELMALRHPNLSIKDIIWLLNHDSIIPREVLGGVGDLL